MIDIAPIAIGSGLFLAGYAVACLAKAARAADDAQIIRAKDKRIAELEATRLAAVILAEDMALLREEKDVAVNQLALIRKQRSEAAAKGNRTRHRIRMEAAAPAAEKLQAAVPFAKAMEVVG